MGACNRWAATAGLLGLPGKKIRMPPTTLTHPDSGRCGTALLEVAPKDSLDELGPVDQIGGWITGPRNVLALAAAVVFGTLRIVQSPCATSRTEGP